jgi:uncharacterized membrane protein YidH (DUF202 family)
MNGSGTRPADNQERDAGLAHERTQLAWTRTAISFAAVGAAVLRTSVAAGAIVVAMSVAIWGLGRLAARNGERSGVVSAATRRRTLQLITAATTLVALTALVLALVSHPQPLLIGS